MHILNPFDYERLYQKSKLIGRGTFGEAWIVKPGKTGKNEITMLKNCRHERIVCYIEDFYENNKILIIMC